MVENLKGRNTQTPCCSSEHATFFEQS